jgi:hypothetical protein
MPARDERARYDIRIYEGATFRKQFQWKTGTPSVAVDITGYTGEMQIRSSKTSDTALITLTTTGEGIEITDPENGIFTINITDETSSNVCSDHEDIKGVYDLLLIAPGQPDGEVTMLLYGECYIVAAVTRGVS